MKQTKKRYIDTEICRTFGISEERQGELANISCMVEPRGETEEERFANALDDLFESDITDVREQIFLSFMLGVTYDEMVQEQRFLSLFS